jgi:hypothetical protein
MKGKLYISARETGACTICGLIRQRGFICQRVIGRTFQSFSIVQNYLSTVERPTIPITLSLSTSKTMKPEQVKDARLGQITASLARNELLSSG